MRREKGFAHSGRPEVCSCFLYFALLQQESSLGYRRCRAIIPSNRTATMQDEDVAEPGGNPQRNAGDSPLHSYQPEKANGFWALVAQGVGTKCTGGWGNAKPAVYSGLQAHIFSLLRRQSQTRRPVSPVAAE